MGQKSLQKAVEAPLEPCPNQSIALHYNASVSRVLSYLEGRGISERVAQEYLLGWNKSSNSISIPCYDENEILWGIKYRLLKPRDKSHRFYSEKGSVSDKLFGVKCVSSRKVPLCIVEESPLDALMWQSHGVAAVAPFALNSSVKAWRGEWSHYLKDTLDIVVMAQEDENGAGELIAAARANEIPRSRIIRMKGFKDSGEYFRAGNNPINLLYG